MTEHAADAAATASAEPSALAGLLERVEAAEGPDREIDCYLEAYVARFTPDGQFHIVGPPSYDPRRLFYNPLPSVNWIGYDLLNTSPAYTASLDAALALVERVLPGWGWCLRDNREGQPFGRGFFANVFPGEPNVDRVFYDALGPTAPLALVAALLKALIASTPDTSTGNERTDRQEQERDL